MSLPCSPSILRQHRWPTGPPWSTATGQDVLVILNAEYDRNTYSVANATIMAGFVQGRGVPRELVDAWTTDLEQLGEHGEYFFSLNRYLFTAHRP
jgi:arsenite methyltransferase